MRKIIIDSKWLLAEIAKAIAYENDQIEFDSMHNEVTKYNEKLRFFYIKIFNIINSKRTEKRKCLLIRELTIKAIKRGFCFGVIFNKIEQNIVCYINEYENVRKAFMIEKEQLKNLGQWKYLMFTNKPEIYNAIKCRCQAIKDKII